MLSVKCDKGHITNKTLKNIRKGSACSICAEVSRRNKKRLIYSEVKFYIESYGYKLISDKYINTKELLTIMCPNGHEYKVNFSNFKYSNRRCSICDDLEKSKEGHPNWKGGITPVNTQIRTSLEYKNWRIEVFKRDNYACQCCGQRGGNLEAHHIENFSDNEELRLDIKNGITLCVNCHSASKLGSFHYIYGKFNNTKEQLEEYIQRYNNDLN